MQAWPVHRGAIEAFAHETGLRADAAHDVAHLARVVACAERLAMEEGASLDVVMPAAWLHDCVHVPVTSPDRPRASVMAGDAAVEFLSGVGYPDTHLDGIHHAIAAHSFSARIAPLTVEARVVQDADRLDALGAIGIARCLMLGGQLGRTLYDVDDPFAERRAPSDAVSSIDHFYTKLLTLADTMQTGSGRREARRRTDYMTAYLQQLRSEL
ncbi:MAG TPA: HD domain-containing protein [Gemmatimonadaceae bacterium]|nr:HD domain-containing protein [Gemmatimonadaceae bacterium]